MLLVMWRRGLLVAPASASVPSFYLLAWENLIDGQATPHAVCYAHVACMALAEVHCALLASDDATFNRAVIADSVVNDCYEILTKLPKVVHPSVAADRIVHALVYFTGNSQLYGLSTALPHAVMDDPVRISALAADERIFPLLQTFYEPNELLFSSVADHLHQLKIAAALELLCLCVWDQMHGRHDAQVLDGISTAIAVALQSRARYLNHVDSAHRMLVALDRALEFPASGGPCVISAPDECAELMRAHPHNKSIQANGIRVLCGMLSAEMHNDMADAVDVVHIAGIALDITALAASNHRREDVIFEESKRLLLMTCGAISLSSGGVQQEALLPLSSIKASVATSLRRFYKSPLSLLQVSPVAGALCAVLGMAPSSALTERHDLDVASLLWHLTESGVAAEVVSAGGLRKLSALNVTYDRFHTVPKLCGGTLRMIARCGEAGDTLCHEAIRDMRTGSELLLASCSALCKRGCRRAVAPGVYSGHKPRQNPADDFTYLSARAFDTCCRECAMGTGGHSPECDLRAEQSAVASKSTTDSTGLYDDLLASMLASEYATKQGPVTELHTTAIEGGSLQVEFQFLSATWHGSLSAGILTVEGFDAAGTVLRSGDIEFADGGYWIKLSS